MELAIFPVWGVVGASILREALLGWLGSCVGKKRKKVWLSVPLCLFWIIWKERNRRAFENEDHLIQWCKSFFLCNLWAWAKGFLVSDPPSIVILQIGWTPIEGVVFFVDPYFFFRHSLASFVYLLYALRPFLDVPFIFNILLFIHQKRCNPDLGLEIKMQKLGFSRNQRRFASFENYVIAEINYSLVSRNKKTLIFFIKELPTTF